MMNLHKLKIGLTGNIGSGKSTVRKVFEILGVPVYDSDSQAKYLINNNSELIHSIKKQFGDDIYLTNGILDNKKLASIVFKDKSKLQILNSIVHPIVKQHFINWYSLQNYAYVIEESAILFETGIYKEMDKNIVVFAPENIRIERVMKRDNASKENVIQRIKNQLSDEEKNKKADFIIYNDNTEQVLPQILELHKSLCEYK